MPRGLPLPIPAGAQAKTLTPGLTIASPLRLRRSRPAEEEMAFMAALEADLRALSAEARRRHPTVKDAAEHAILKVRLSLPK